MRVGSSTVSPLDGLEVNALRLQVLPDCIAFSGRAGDDAHGPNRIATALEGLEIAHQDRKLLFPGIDPLELRLRTDGPSLDWVCICSHSRATHVGIAR